MRERGDRADRKLPTKTQHDVNKDQDQRDEHRKAALLRQVFADLRLDELDTPQLGRRVNRAQGPQNTVANCAAILILLWRQPDQYLVNRTEVLYQRCAEPSLAKNFADCRQICVALIGDLEQDAAREIDAEVQAAREDRAQRADDEHGRAYERHATPAHEVETRSLTEQHQVCSARPPIDNRSTCR